MGFVSRWHRRLPGHTSHSTTAPPSSSSRRKSAALSREGVQPTKGQALPATESPRLPVPASPRSSSPGPGGSEGRGPGWSPQPRAAPCCALLREASAAGGWRLCGLARAARSVPGGGARRHRGQRRIPQVLPPPPSPPGLSALVAFWAPLPSTLECTEARDAKYTPTCCGALHVAFTLGFENSRRMMCVATLG